MKKQAPFQLRQGDVLIERIESLPINLKQAKNSILALGESHGHGHIVFGSEVLEGGDGELYLSVDEEAQLKHLMVSSGVWTGEHHPVVIPAGKYRVIPQQEYDPYSDAVRRVQD